MNTSLPLWMLCLVWLLPATVLAAPALESPRTIAAAAVAARDLGQGGQATVDDNLRLARCPEPLATRVSAAQTVEVSCASAGWRVFVPVTVRNAQSVVVLRRPVAAGQTLVAEDLDTVRRDTARSAQALLVDPAQAIGRVARRPLQAGSLVATGDLHAEQLVRRGQQVDLVTRRGSVEIRAVARALRDGAAGDQITVENLSTRRQVQATVASDGTVFVR